MLSALRKIRYLIVNPRIVHNKNEIRSDTKLSFYPIVGFKQTKTGAMTLNKPDNNNNITEECADQLYRFLTTYQHDHTVENVWIQNKGPAFSGGADYEELTKNFNYLDKLMRLSIMVAHFNKPVFAKVHGSVRGIAAYLLTMFSTPLGTQRSTLRLDETSRGFVPIFGGTHRLSRLPCNIGLYLALTGDKLDSQQMSKLGFLKGFVQDAYTNKQVRKNLSDANLFFRYNYNPSSFTPSQDRRQNLVLYKMNYFYDLISETQKQLFKNQNNFYSSMATNQYRIAQTQFYNTTNPYNSFTKTNYQINNYFKMKHDIPFNYLKQKKYIQEAKSQNNLLSRLPVHKLIKVFNKNSLKEVLEQLANDKSEWARKTEEMIRQKDPLASHLTFHLIKNAKDLTFVESLEQQYKIARKLLNISKLKTIEISKGRTLKILTNNYSGTKIQSIPQKTILSFIGQSQSNNQSQIFDHDTPTHSLLPTSDYWRQIPDAGRHLINETFFEDYHSKFIRIEAKAYLHQMKINYKDCSFSIGTLRQYVNKKYHYQKLLDLQKQRINAILQSQAFYKNLKQQRLKYAQQKIKDPSFPALLAKQIEKYFDKKFQSRYAQLQKTAKIAGKQHRLDMIRKYVNTCIDNIVLNGAQIQSNLKQSNIRYDGLIRFSQDKNSDAFHAENFKQKTFAEYNVLKEAYKDGKNPQKLKQMDPNKPLLQDYFDKLQITQWQHQLIKKDAALRINYGKTIIPEQIAIKYKILIDRAGQTSQQIAQLMGWQISDIQSMLSNSPPTATPTFRQFADKIIEKPQNIQERIEKLNFIHKLVSQDRIEKQLKKISQLQKNHQKTHHKDIFFNLKMIPRQFRDLHMPLLDEAVSHFTEKYEIDNSMHSSLQSSNKDTKSFIDKWATKGLRQNYTKLMKSDVQYVFSYLVILQLKQMLQEANKNQLTKPQQIKKFLLQKYNLNFDNFTDSQFSNVFMRYFYDILDMHENSKHRIIFPQTKLIQFLKRIKIDKQLSQKNSRLSFDSLVQLIAKDRKRIRDDIRGVVPLLGYDPQLTLNTISSQFEQFGNGYMKIQQINGYRQGDIHQYQSPLGFQNVMNLTQNLALHKNNKKLVSGFLYYLHRLEAMIHKIAGNTMFLPKQLYRTQAQQTYNNVKQLLRIQYSPEKWFKLKLQSAINNLFEFRLTKEKNMTQGQLMLFDEEFKQLFTPDMVSLVMKYQLQTQEAIAKMILNQKDQIDNTNEDINSSYLDLKNQIKNPKALKILNNLVMTRNVINDRLRQLKKIVGRKDQSLAATIEQMNDLDYQKQRQVSPRTITRLAQQISRFPDQNVHSNQNYQRANQAVQFTPKIQQSNFMSELNDMLNILQQPDLKAELQNRIRRVQALQKLQQKA